MRTEIIQERKLEIQTRNLNMEWVLLRIPHLWSTSFFLSPSEQDRLSGNHRSIYKIQCSLVKPNSEYTFMHHRKTKCHSRLEIFQRMPESKCFLQMLNFPLDIQIEIVERRWKAMRRIVVYWPQGCELSIGCSYTCLIMRMELGCCEGKLDFHWINISHVDRALLKVFTF